MTPEQLVEKMSKSLPNMHKVLNMDFVSETMLRIVLQAIEDGEVVDANGRCFAELKPSFSKFLEGA